jgi:hypothetical protein
LLLPPLIRCLQRIWFIYPCVEASRDRSPLHLRSLAPVSKACAPDFHPAHFHFAFCPRATTLPRVAFLCIVLAGNQRSTLLSLLSCWSVKNLYPYTSVASTWCCVSLSGFCSLGQEQYILRYSDCVSMLIVF